MIVLNSRLTQEVLVIDLRACIEMVIRDLAEHADKNHRKYQRNFASPLFCSTWKEVQSNNLSIECYGWFDSTLKEHVKKICTEFARLTKMESSHNTCPGFIISKDYRTKDCVHVNDMGYFNSNISATSCNSVAR